MCIRDSLYPDSVNLYNILGSTNLALKQFKSAIENFKKAIKICPNLPIIFYNLGLSFHYNKNLLFQIEKNIKDGNLSLKNLVKNENIILVKSNEEDFFNLNSFEDLNKFKSILNII